MGLCDRLQLYGTFLPASADNRLALKQQTWPWTRLLCLRRPGNHCVHCGSAPSVGHVAVRVDFVARSLLSQGGGCVPRTWPATRDLPLQAIAADFAVSSCPRRIFLVKLPPRLPSRLLFGSGTGPSERRQSGIIVRLYMRVVRSGIYVDTQSFGRQEVSSSQNQKHKVHRVCQFFARVVEVSCTRQDFVTHVKPQSRLCSMYNPYQTRAPKMYATYDRLDGQLSGFHQKTFRQRALHISVSPLANRVCLQTPC